MAVLGGGREIIKAGANPEGVQQGVAVGPFEQRRLGHRADGTGVNRHPSLLSIARLKLFLPSTIASPSPGAVGRAGYRHGEAQLDRKSSEAGSRAGRDDDRRRL